MHQQARSLGKRSLTSKLLLLLITGLFWVHADAQDRDSLLGVWRDGTQPMRGRFDALSEYCWALKEVDGDSALQWSITFVNAARERGTPEDLADALNTLGNVQIDLGQMKGALNSLLLSDRIYAQYAPARRGTILSNLSLVYQELGDHTQAIQSLLSAISIGERAKDTSLLLSAHGNLAVLYGMRRDYVRSAASFERTVEWAGAMGDEALLAQCLDNLGTVYSEQGQLQKALAMLNRAFDIYQGLGKNQMGYANNLSNLGILHQKLGDLERAHALLHQAAVAFSDADHQPDLATTLINIGGNDIMRGRSQDAVTSCNRALGIARASNALSNQQYACECLFQAYEALGRPLQALNYHKRMVVLRDSLINEANIQDMTRMEMRFGFAQEQLTDSLAHAAALAQVESERTIEQLRADRNRNGALAIGGGGVLLLFGGSMWFHADRKRRQERFEKEAATLETQALRSQMNPHFIFNALNSINAYVQQNDQDSAGRYLTKFARVMRRVLENSRHGEVALSEDLDALRGYMELERMRMQHKFDFSITVADDLDPDEVLVPPLVVQPFVENAIWHGLARKEGQGHITLHVRQDQGQLIWTIDDDGVGRTAKKSHPSDFARGTIGDTKKTSLGTAITRSRLDLVQKQHGGRAGFRYVDLEQGTRVEVEMPLLSST